MDSSAIHGQSCTEFFTQTVPGRGGKYYFGRSSVKSPAGSLLLFQMRSKLVASARLKKTVKGPVTNEWGERQGGYYVLDVDSISIPPEPMTLEEFIRIVPPFEGKRFSNAMHVVPSEYEGPSKRPSVAKDGINPPTMVPSTSPLWSRAWRAAGGSTTRRGTNATLRTGGWPSPSTGQSARPAASTLRRHTVRLAEAS